MKEKILTYGFILMFLIPFLLSCSKNTIPQELFIIPVGQEVGKANILRASDYIKDICYASLETNDSIVISEITQIVYEDSLLVITDRTSNHLYVFNKDGRFVNRIGNVGDGPDEYNQIRSFQWLPESRLWLVDASPRKIVIYDSEGKLQGHIRPKQYPEEYIISQLTQLTDHYYIADVVAYGNTYYPKAMLFCIENAVGTMIKEFPNHIPLKKDERRGYSLMHEVATMYHFGDEIRMYKTINDTVFTIGKDTEMKAAYVFDFGKYGASPEWKLALDSEQELKYIWPLNIQKSADYLFLEFFFGNHAPEKFEHVQRYSSGTEVKMVNYNVCGIFDKHTGKLTVMKQPVKTKQGFKNDLDSGPVIWPAYISSNDELVSYFDAEDFLTFYEGIENPSPELTKIAKTLNPDDNPVVIIARLKNR